MIEATLEKLDRALDLVGTHTLGDVMKMVDRGEAMVWMDAIDGDAIIVTEIYTFPQKGKVVHFWLAGGEMDAVLRLQDKVLEWARSQGIKHATLVGRMGWSRALADHGWQNRMISMEREL